MRGKGNSVGRKGGEGGIVWVENEGEGGIVWVENEGEGDQPPRWHLPFPTLILSNSPVSKKNYKVCADHLMTGPSSTSG